MGAVPAFHRLGQRPLCVSGMMKNPLKWFYGYLFLLVLLLLSFFWQPCFCIYGGGRMIASAPAIPGMPFSIHFIHSVQKTPVRENLVVEGEGFRLESTEYQSFGVGLPFLESEGNFRMEGDAFVMEHMDRHFPDLSLRTGVGTELRISLNGKEYRLYEMFPPGTKIDIFLVPFYRLLF